MPTPTKAELLALLQAEKLGSPKSDAIQQYVLSTFLDKNYDVSVQVPLRFVFSATATNATPALVGTVYLTESTFTTASLAYIGGTAVGDATTLTLVPAGGGAAVATWTRTGFLGSQALASSATITSPGWYDLILTPGASGTGFARGLYLI